MTEIVKMRARKNQVCLLLTVLIASVCAVGDAQPPKLSPEDARQLNASKANLNAIWRAVSQYCDKHGRFPARALLDTNGKPLLSWRVSILPFLGQEELYRQFKLNEPWDSPTNRRLVLRMPAVFRNPNDTTGQPLTNYVVPVGAGTVFGGTVGIRRADITDGTRFTIMFIEADDDQRVVWTKPEDLSYDPRRPTKGLGSLRADRFLVMMADGRAVPIAKDIDRRFLRSFFTYAAGDNTWQDK